MKRIVKSLIRYLGYEIRAAQGPDRRLLFDETAIRDYGALKPFATRAAQFAESPEQRRAVRNIHLAGLLREQPVPQYTRVPIGDEKTSDVGIWRREAPGKEMPFIRRQDLRGQWHSWASIEKIGPKRSRWRVALLGESVARGLLYDPHFNVAAAVNAMLESQIGPGKIDVIDLAKSNQTIHELRTSAGESLALSPDVLVVFAGNNWRPHLAEPDIPFAESILRQEGAPGLKLFLDEQGELAARNLVVQMSSLAAPRGIRIIWVVPEFNLVDWADPASGAPHLARQGNRRWRDLDRQAGLALQMGDSEAAYELAKKMTDLDGGTSSVPLRILAEGCRSRADLAGARRNLELCRDAEGWDPGFSYSPRVSSPIQRALRAAASLPGNVVVDLPEIFGRHLNGALPDRRLFLDYCHLTAEGIGVAAAAIVAPIVSLLAGRTIAPQTLERTFVSPPAKIEGKACFLAAVHNAHFYQTADVVNYWCDRAIEAWPESAELMTRYIDCQTLALPMMACKSGIELLELDELDTLRYLSRGGTRRLDLTLSDAVASSLDRSGYHYGRDVADLRLKRHSLKSGPKELTDFYYNSAIPSRCERGWTSRSFASNRGSHRMYASAFWETSRFIFFAECGQAVGLKLAYRVPGSSANGVVRIGVNGRCIAELPAKPSWCAGEVSVSPECILEGINEVWITWPSEDDESSLALNQAADDLAARRLPYFFKVFGEIHTLSAFYPTASPASSE